MDYQVAPQPPRAERITAGNDAEYVRILNDTARAPAPTVESYMARFSTMYEAQSGIRVRWDSPEEFVTDLMSAGRITKRGDTYTLWPSLLS